MRITDVEMPATTATKAAREVASAYCTPALLNHSERAYLWAAAYAHGSGITFDAELLGVSALLHDIGLTTTFDSHTVDFETAGGHVAWVLTTGLDWAPPRRARAAEIIVRHMWPQVDPTSDSEGHLLEVSTGMDISGRSVDLLPVDLRAEVLDRYPRLDIAEQFTACFTDQAMRKPSSAAAGLVAAGIAERIAANPLE